MKPMQKIAQYLLTLPADAVFTTRMIAAALDGDPKRISQSLKQLHLTAAVMIAKRGACRPAGNEYRIADRTKLEARVAGAIGPGRTKAPESDFLTYAIDHDGDLQILRPDGTVTMIDNANARRLVGFVSLHATAILMAGSQ